jgi:hypothetical protein
LTVNWMLAATKTGPAAAVSDAFKAAAAAAQPDDPSSSHNQRQQQQQHQPGE